ncbi:MAG: hypothetical protein V2A54_15300 [Bacteroidota bacterium]
MDELFIKITRTNTGLFLAECETLKFSFTASSIDGLRKGIKDKIIENCQDYKQINYIKMYLSDQDFSMRERRQDFFSSVK